MARRRPPFIPPERQPRRPLHEASPGRFLPTVRLAPLVRRWLDEGNVVEQLSATDKRVLFGMLNERESVHVDTADRILVAIGLSHYWYLPPDQGGLSDHYFHESVVGEAA